MYSKETSVDSNISFKHGSAPEVAVGRAASTMHFGKIVRNFKLWTAAGRQSVARAACKMQKMQGGTNKSSPSDNDTEYDVI